MIKQNVSLKQFSTLKVGGQAEFFTKVSTKKELLKAVEFAKEKYLNITVLGSVSNVIISDEGIKGLVIMFDNANITLNNSNQVTAGAGTIWDDFVSFCVKEKLYGVENLSYIPGTVGASAVQNIGAYGQDVSSTIYKVTALDLTTNEFVEFTNKECKFSYRQSIFNSSDKGRYIIFEITYQLAENGEFSLGYQDMAYFREDKDLTLEKIRLEIIKIRTNKLPDYDVLPNVGSFFKNIVIKKENFPNLVEKARAIDLVKAEKLQSFETSRETVKVPTALLIDICGLKGYKQEHIGIYDQHALIVVNHSQQGTCQDVLDFSKYISTTIFEALGVTIEREPTVIG